MAALYDHAMLATSPVSSPEWMEVLVGRVPVQTGRRAVQLAEPAPFEHVQFVVPPRAGNAGLAGLAFPTAQIVPEKLFSVDW